MYVADFKRRLGELGFEDQGSSELSKGTERMNILL